MTLLLACVRDEWRLQLRSLRFRFGAAVYLIVGCLPAWVLFANRDSLPLEIGPGSYVSQVSMVAPFLTALLAVIVVGNTAKVSGELTVIGPSRMSSAAYVVRRWLAMLCVILPLTVLPLAASVALSLVAGAGLPSPGTVLWPWLLRIVPVAMSVSAYWFGALRVLDSELAAGIVSLYFWQLVLAVINRVVFPLRLRYGAFIPGDSNWSGFREIVDWFTIQSFLVDRSFREANPWYRPNFLASEAPFDPDLAVQALWPRMALILAVSVFVLTLAAAYVGRTRPDSPPQDIRSDHPIRNFLRYFGQLRHRFRPDPALAIRDRAFVLLGVILSVSIMAALTARSMTFEALAEERFAVESDGWPRPTALDVVPAEWSITGRLDVDGGVDLEVAGTLRNEGSTAQTALAFSLDRQLRITELDVVGRRVESERRWDRLHLQIEPPLESGGEIDLHFRLQGTPALIYMPLVGMYSDSWATRWAGTLHPRFPRELPNMSYGEFRRYASPRSVHLSAPSLSPVPRYSSWELTPPPDSPGATGNYVPEDSVRPLADLDLDLQIPLGWFVADSCGHVSRERDGDNALRGRCTQSVADLALLGGSLTLVGSDDGRAVFAALPAHHDRAEDLVQTLARVAEVSDRAWPGMAGVDRLVGVESPPDFRLDRQRAFRIDSQLRVTGNVVRVPEALVVERQPLEIDDLVAQLLVADLMARRQFNRAEAHIFRSLFRSLMLSRMGLGRERPGRLTGRPWSRTSFATPILAAGAEDRRTWELRLPAVLSEIEGRVGPEALVGGIETFLAEHDAPPGSLRQLIAAVEAASGESLEGVYQDYFVGRGLPELRLEKVDMRPRQSGWRVEGEVRNVGLGAVRCPVLVKTEGQELSVILDVGGESATQFTVDSPNRPHTVLLDPAGGCIRWFQHAPHERVDLTAGLS